MIKSFFCLFFFYLGMLGFAQNAHAYDADESWVLSPTSGYDTASVHLDSGPDKSAHVSSLRTNYYPGKHSDTWMSIHVDYAPHHTCSLTSKLHFVRNAFIMDEFEAKPVMHCDGSTFPVRLKAAIQYQVHNTLFIETTIIPAADPIPGMHLPTEIRAKTTLQYEGTESNSSGCTGTVLDIGSGRKTHFPVTQQGDCGSITPGAR